MFLFKRCERRKKVNNKWVEGTPNPDLLHGRLPPSQPVLVVPYYMCLCLVQCVMCEEIVLLCLGLQCAVDIFQL